LRAKFFVTTGIAAVGKRDLFAGGLDALCCANYTDVASAADVGGVADNGAGSGYADADVSASIAERGDAGGAGAKCVYYSRAGGECEAN